MNINDLFNYLVDTAILFKKSCVILFTNVDWTTAPIVEVMDAFATSSVEIPGTHHLLADRLLNNHEIYLLEDLMLNEDLETCTSLFGGSQPTISILNTAKDLTLEAEQAQLDQIVLNSYTLAMEDESPLVLYEYDFSEILDDKTREFNEVQQEAMVLAQDVRRSAENLVVEIRNNTYRNFLAEADGLELLRMIPGGTIPPNSGFSSQFPRLVELYNSCAEQVTDVFRYQHELAAISCEKDVAFFCQSLESDPLQVKIKEPFLFLRFYWSIKSWWNPQFADEHKNYIWRNAEAQLKRSMKQRLDLLQIMNPRRRAWILRNKDILARFKQVKNSIYDDPGQSDSIRF